MKRSAAPRKRVVRQVTRAERVMGVIVLVLLACVAGFVHWKGQRYDPALFALDEGLLPGQAAGVAPTTEVGVLPIKVEELGWRPAGEVERFTAETLYIKIDGRAEQYIQYGVKSLECQTYVPAKSPDAFLDIFVYDMGSPLQAFGIFSAERTPGKQGIALGEQGYRSGANLFFWQGAFYVQVLASEDTPAMREVADRTAQVASAVLPRGEVKLWPLQVWNGAPWEADTLQYQRRNALTLEFLHHAFTIHRRGDPETALAFLSLRGSEQEAQELWGKFIEYYQGYGKIHQRIVADAGEWLVADIAGFYDGVYREGPLLAGVTGFGDAQAALARLTELRERLQQVPADLWQRVLPEWSKVLAAPVEEPEAETGRTGGSGHEGD